MGIETAAAIGAGASLLNSVGGYAESRAARKRQGQAQDQALALTQGPNAVDQFIMGQLSKPNSGQDGFLQYLRSNPGGLKPFQYDQSQAFKGLQAQDNYTINDQVNQLRSSAGSLGQRFGSGFASKEAILRSRFGADISARNAGISQNSFNNALQFGLQGYGLGQQQQNGLLSLLLSSQQGRTGQQLQALGFGAQPLPSAVQPLAQGGTDIAQLLLLGNYLRNNPGGATSTPTAGTNTGYSPQARWGMNS